MPDRAASLDAAFRRDAARVLAQSPALLRRLAERAAHADVFVSHHLARRLEVRRRLARRPPPPTERERRRSGLGLRAWSASGPQRLAAGRVADADALARALLARLDGPGHDVRPFAPPRLPDRPPDAPSTSGRAERAAVVEAALDAALGADGRVRHAAVVLQEHQRHALVVASDGRAGASLTAHVALRVDAVLRIDGMDVAGYATGGAAGLGALLADGPEQVAARAVEHARHRAAAMPWQATSTNVVLAPGWGGVWLHEAVGHRLEADVAASVQPGARIAPPGTGVVDDGTSAEGRFLQPTDDEGWPAQTTLLVDDGRLAAHLTDAFEAQRRGLPRTGNGRRADFASPVVPRMTNLALRAGDADAEALLRAAGDGLWVSRLGRGQVRPGGAFALEVLAARRIEGGRLGGAVADVWIEGDAARSLADLGGIGADLAAEPGRGLCEKQGQVVPVGVAMPTVWLRGLGVRQSPT